MWYAIIGNDRKDSLQARMAARPAHVARLEALRDAGRLRLAGPFPAIDAEDRVRKLRQLDSKHPFTLLCGQLSEAGRLARLDDPAFRLLRSLTPGPCTFILPASAELPKRIRDGGRSKRRTIGIRLPDHVVAQALLEAMGEPLLSASLVFPDVADLVSNEADSVADCCLRWVDLMLDAGDCPPGPTSMVDCTGDEPEILRQGFQPVDLQRPTRRK